MSIFKKKQSEIPECGVSNLCCDDTGTPRIILVGENNNDTYAFHDNALEAADKSKSPLHVHLSFSVDSPEAAGHEPPILFIKGEIVSEGVYLSTEEIEKLLVKFDLSEII